MGRGRRGGDAEGGAGKTRRRATNPRAGRDTKRRRGRGRYANATSKRSAPRAVLCATPVPSPRQEEARRCCETRDAVGKNVERELPIFRRGLSTVIKQFL